VVEQLLSGVEAGELAGGVVVVDFDAQATEQVGGDLAIGDGVVAKDTRSRAPSMLAAKWLWAISRATFVTRFRLRCGDRRRAAVRGRQRIGRFHRAPRR
jgi:hypothetical protein